jgi:hypothetical protein
MPAVTTPWAYPQCGRHEAGSIRPVYDARKSASHIGVKTHYGTKDSFVDVAGIFLYLRAADSESLGVG